MGLNNLTIDVRPRYCLMGDGSRSDDYCSLHLTIKTESDEYHLWREYPNDFFESEFDMVMDTIKETVKERVLKR